ncbi:MAG: hypothetical protein HOE11_04650 [Candidatus Diapherotrites archaeon]|jgi:hypothetical protein|nr:hypothetical protein [Candidatus Diapherotrites archaeon]
MAGKGRYEQPSLFGGRISKVVAASTAAHSKDQGKNARATIFNAMEQARLEKKKKLNIYDAFTFEARRTKNKHGAVRNILEFLNHGGRLHIAIRADARLLLKEAEEKVKAQNLPYHRKHRRLRLYKSARMKIEQVIGCEIYLRLKKAEANGRITEQIRQGIMKEALAATLRFIHLK